jgi:hypothetical protein
MARVRPIQDSCAAGGLPGGYSSAHLKDLPNYSAGREDPTPGPTCPVINESEVLTTAEELRRYLISCV